MLNLSVRERRIADLKVNPRNPRIHSKKQIRQIANSIREFGFTNPILLGDDDEILAGHGRVAAAKLLGLETVPTIHLANLSEAQRRAYVIADNKLAENAGWDKDLLVLEFQYLTDLDTEFDVTITGFETPEIDMLIQSIGEVANDDEADAPPPEPENSFITSKLGDLWSLGRHRLLVGDARDAASLDRLMAGEWAEMVFIDPPYNVPIAGNVGGLGKIHHKDFVMGVGELSPAAFTIFLASAFDNLARHSVDGSIHYVCMDWRHMEEVLSAARQIYPEMKNLCVWVKDNAGMGTFYRSQHELIFAFKNGTAPHINNFELGQHGRHRSNVWTYPGVNTFRAGRLDELGMHPTVKPVAMVVDAILDCSNRNGIVLDIFVGSGTTIIAAERTGRRAYAMELDPVYVDTAIRRWQALTGEEARLIDTGKGFEEVGYRRAELAYRAIQDQEKGIDAGEVVDD